MPEAVQQSLAIDTPAAPPAAKAPAAPVKGRFNLPAESEPAPKPAPASAEPAQKPAVEAPEAQPEESDKPEPTPEEAEKRRESRRFERRIDKLHRQAAEARARAELAEKQLRERDVAAKPVDPGEPKLEQFDYDPEKYAQAKAEYTKKLAEKEWEAKQRTAETTKQREKLVSSWEEKVEKAADKYDDFTTIVGELQPTSPLITAIMESDADVAYYLGKHPKEAERIAGLGQISQIREIGKLEAKLAAEPEKPKAPSKAPAPIKPLSGAGSTATDVPSETDDTAAWIKKRQKQVHGKR
jgi:hypothetical protein